MNSVEYFLAHAVALEREAARRYEELAAAMGTEGNRELALFFTRMAHYSRLHLSDAMARGGFRKLPPLAAHEYDWPDGTSPEMADWAGVDALMGVQEALRLALDGERRGHAYYALIAASTADAELQRIAQAFADEESEHVRELERQLQAHATTH
ncbi:MAG: ferritin family protein [Piscinibacter sp.]|nr:ferritin family protein [Piscinibacter sp.]